MNIAEMYKALFEALRDCSISEVARVASEMMGMPIVVTDATFVVLAKHPAASFGDEQWDANMVDKQIHPEYIRVFQQDSHWDAYEAAQGGPIFIDWGFFKESPRYSAQIYSGGHVCGYVSTLLNDAQCEDWHIPALQVVADALAIVMEMQHRSQRGSDIMASVMLQGLLMNEFSNYEEFEHLCVVTGEKLQPDYVLAGIRTRNPLNAPLESYLGEAFGQYYQNSLQVVQGDCLYVLLSGVDEGFKEASYFKEAIHRFKESEAVCAFSRRFEKIFPITDYKWQVDHLLDICGKVRPDKTLFHFDDYSLYAILDSVTSEISSENLTHPLLPMLARYDESHGTDYLNTLRVYTLLNYSKSATAQALHVHRNTLLYRIDKIEEIVGASIIEGDLGFSLHLSFLCEDMRDISRRGSLEGAMASVGGGLLDDTSSC